MLLLYLVRVGEYVRVSVKEFSLFSLATEHFHWPLKQMVIIWVKTAFTTLPKVRTGVTWPLN